MKSVILGVGFSVCLLMALVVAQQSDATAEQASDAPVAAAVTSPQVVQSAPVEPAPQAELCAVGSDSPAFGGANAVPLKKCSFNSDCKYGKCKSGKCGACSFNSDCKGWGKCKSGKCGACSFSSECKGFGGCSGGRCKKSPY